MNDYAVVCLEDLNVKGMLSNHNMAQGYLMVTLTENRARKKQEFNISAQ